MQINLSNYKNLPVFNFAILLKSRKFNARETYVFYGIYYDYAKPSSNMYFIMAFVLWYN